MVFVFVFPAGIIVVLVFVLVLVLVVLGILLVRTDGGMFDDDDDDDALILIPGSGFDAAFVLLFAAAVYIRFNFFCISLHT